MNSYINSFFSKKTILQAIYKKYQKRCFDISIEKLNSGFAAPPERLYISLTQNCQCNCIMCANSKKKKEKNFMEVEMLKNIIDELREHNTYFIFYRQEPLIHPKIDECLNIITKNGLICQITTNGILLEECAEIVSKNNVDRLWVSLDGPPDIHDKIRGHKGCFNKALQGIEKVYEVSRRNNTGYPAMIGVSVSCHSVSYLHLTELVNILKDYPIQKIVINHLKFCTKSMAECDKEISANYSLDDDDSLLDIDPVQMMDVIEQVREIAPDKIDFKPFLKSVGMVERYYKSIKEPVVNAPCISPWFSADLLVDGKLSFCSIINGLDCGQLNNDKDFSDIWNSEQACKNRLFILNNTPYCSCGRCSHILATPEVIFSELFSVR